MGISHSGTPVEMKKLMK
uniref:Uncharacterized protein n=1 Tax=Anguilla anguilla TaxID=7936 RepID=A0A0E9R9U0_ANGAN